MKIIPQVHKDALIKALLHINEKMVLPVAFNMPNGHYLLVCIVRLVIILVQVLEELSQLIQP